MKSKKELNATSRCHYRQGDVLIETIDTIPATATRQKPAKQVILAHGEVTGHHHQLEVRRPEKNGKWHDPADWWKEGEIAPSLEKPATLAGEIFVTLPEGGVVTHDEHSQIELPPGNYRVTRQREYSPSAIRNVAD